MTQERMALRWARENKSAWLAPNAHRMVDNTWAADILIPPQVLGDAQTLYMLRFCADDAETAERHRFAAVYPYGEPDDITKNAAEARAASDTGNSE